MKTKIKVIDAICGAGKTSYAIQMMNDSKIRKGFDGVDIIASKGKKFVYVTPFLEEVERIINHTNLEFVQPVSFNGSKMSHFKELIEAERNIVITHELFSRIDEETLSDIEMLNYTLIMDEVANVLDNVDISRSDIELLLSSNYIEVDEGKINWIDENYNSSDTNNRLGDIKLLADNDNLYLSNGVAMYWTMNVKAFTSFKEVYILTYLFDGQIQKYYYDMFDVEYEKFSVRKVEEKYELVEYDKNNDERTKIKELLNIFENYTKKGSRGSYLNTNYEEFDNPKKDPKYFLSSSWFRKASDEKINQLQKNLSTYFRSQLSVSNDKLFWTTKKSIAEKLKNVKCKYNKKDDRSKDNFLSMNARATNGYSDRTAMAYVYNRFMNPMEKAFFESNGIKVDEDLLAVSDLIQFLFRGCIRKEEEMSCYIPSPRMRELLKDWLEYKI